MNDAVPTVTEVYEAIRRMHEALDLRDRVFTIRDTEMRGEDGPRVQAWVYGLEVLGRAGLLSPPTQMMLVHQAGPAVLGVQACARCGEILIDGRGASSEPAWWRGRVRVYLGKARHYVGTSDPATCVRPVDDRESTNANQQKETDHG